MASYTNITAEEDADQILHNRVIISLTDSLTSTDTPCESSESGFIRIFEAKKLIRKDKRLIKYIQSGRGLFPEIHEADHMGQQESDTMHKKFANVERCLEYVKACKNKGIVVILSPSHARNKQLIAMLNNSSQIISVLRLMTKEQSESLRMRWSFESRNFVRYFLPQKWTNTHIENLDSDDELLLKQIFLVNCINGASVDKNAKTNFLDFCRSKYQSEPTYSKQIKEFEQEYGNGEYDAIKWYTKSSSFVCKIICETCASRDFTAFFNIRFILRDLHLQLKTLHEEQLEELLCKDLIVYRGKFISVNELEQLKNPNQLFITRNFLSTTTEADIAVRFSGLGAQEEGKVPVIFRMNIHRGEIKTKPIARIHEHSEIKDEKEVLLPISMVFRVVSFKERHDSTGHLTIFKVVRGTTEVDMEKLLNKSSLSVAAAVTGLVSDVSTLLTTADHCQYTGKYTNLIPHELKELNTPTVEQPPVTSDGPKSLHMRLDIHDRSEIDVPENQEHSTIAHESHQNANTCSELNTADLPLPNHSTLTRPMATNHLGTFSKIMSLTTTPRGKLMVISVAVVLAVTGMVTSLAIILPSKRFLTTTTTCPPIICSPITTVTNPSANYQVEQLNLTCSQTLSNMSIIQTVQRMYNETHAQQYQTFWINSTNMTYVDTPTQIIYYWYSIPGMLIVRESFPHFIEAQYYYNTSIRNTSLDTWHIWVQSNTCGDTLYLSGTY